jgi:hypothetical protein
MGNYAKLKVSISANLGRGRRGGGDALNRKYTARPDRRFLKERDFKSDRPSRF